MKVQMPVDSGLSGPKIFPDGYFSLVARAADRWVSFRYGNARGMYLWKCKVNFLEDTVGYVLQQL